MTYAKSRGIRVIPEFDTPGHTFAMQFGDAQVMQCVSVADSVPDMCPEPPCGYLNVSDEDAYQVVLDVYKDAWGIFEDSFFHIGADEVEQACWGKQTDALYVEWIETMCSQVDLVGHRTPILWSGGVDVSAQIGQNNFDIVMQMYACCVLVLVDSKLVEYMCLPLSVGTTQRTS